MLFINRRQLLAGASALAAAGPAYALSPADKAAIFSQGSLGVLQLNSPMILTGDSWVSGSNNYNSIIDNRGNRWAVPNSLMEYVGNKWRMTVQGNKAVSGTTSAQVSTQLAGAMATLPSGKPFIWGCFERYLNDLSVPTAPSGPLANLNSDIQTVLNTGLGRCFIGNCPFQQPGGSWSATQINYWATYNQGVKAIANRYGKYVRVLDYSKIGLVASDYSNNIHLTSNGWDKVAAWVWSSGLIADWLPPQAVISKLSTEYCTNPGLTGGSSTGPTGFSFGSQGGITGVTQTWSTAAKTWTISGTASGFTAGSVGAFCYMTYASGASIPGAAALTEGIIDYNILDATGLILVGMQSIIDNASFTPLSTGYSSSYGPGVADPTVLQTARALGQNFVGRSPQIAVGTGTPAHSDVNAIAFILPGTVNAVIRMNRLTTQLCV